MKRGRVVVGSSAALLAVLLGFGYQVFDRWLTHLEVEKVSAREEALQEACEADGGRWWRGDCER